MATRDIVRGRKTYTDFSEVNRFQDSKDAFFAGVQYAFDNLAPAEAGVPATDVNEQAERAQPIGLLSQLSGGQQLARLARIG
ncbi:hypothetical protein TUN199_11845 [Pyrenophora tritici-repentis]|nr:hypothetical protein Alg130_11945 [Pyrenophora tritici-repentis]KAI0616168.1 hypothetical protein TUN199_11845 [Pyrenophora tritici-repentis]